MAVVGDLMVVVAAGSAVEPVAGNLVVVPAVADPAVALVAERLDFAVVPAGVDFVAIALVVVFVVQQRRLGDPDQWVLEVGYSSVTERERVGLGWWQDCLLLAAAAAAWPFAASALAAEPADGLVARSDDFVDFVGFAGPVVQQPVALDVAVGLGVVAAELVPADVELAANVAAAVSPGLLLVDPVSEVED